MRRLEGQTALVTGAGSGIGEEAARAFLRRGVVPERSKAAGKIVFMSSVHEVIPWAGHANYATSKGGMMMLMQTIARELAPQEIRVNSIAPGAIESLSR